MSGEQIRQLIQRGILAAKAGQQDEARKILQQALKLDPNNEVAWLALVSVMPEAKDRVRILKRVLEINPDNVRARGLLEKMGIPPERLVGTTQPEPPAPAPERDVQSLRDVPDMDDLRAMDDAYEDEDEEPYPPMYAGEEEGGEDFGDPFAGRELTSSTAPVQVQPLFDRGVPQPEVGDSGIPVPDLQLLEQAAALAEQSVTRVLDARAKGDSINWATKTRGRAGEREVWIPRLRVGAAIGTLAAIIIIVGGAILLRDPDVQQRLGLLPTATRIPPSLTPTFTPTLTPTIGATRTPSPTPEAILSPSPTINPNIRLMNADPRFPTPTPTDLYQPGGLIINRVFVEADELIKAGRLDEAFDLMEGERLANSGGLGYPYPYYYLALIYLGRDEPDNAETILSQGLDAVQGNQNREQFLPMYNIGFSWIALYRAEQAHAESNTRVVNQQVAEIQARIEEVTQADAAIEDAYIVEARALTLQQNYDEAIELLNNALVNVPDFLQNVNLRVEIARIMMQQERYDDARQQLTEVLKINPYSEDAYPVIIEAALQLGDPGLAVIYAEAYLLYFPENVRAYTLLGQAREAENKDDQAIIAYTAALQGDPEDPAYLDALLARSTIYLEQERYEDALAGFTEALDYTDSPEVRRTRMYSALALGNYALIADDIDVLRGSGLVPESELNLLDARILVDQADENDTSTYEQSRQLINTAINQGLAANLRPTADEYLARSEYYLGNYEQARIAIERALSAAESGSRHYLYGLISEELGELEIAQAQYEWVLAWGEIFPYAFYEDAATRYDAVTDLILNPPDPTPTPESS